MGRWNKELGLGWKVFAAALALMLALTACRSTADQLQEQLDLGQRYLQELNYTEAIAAFTKAIEIDPKQVQAYVGRADAYMGLYESGDEENLQLAQTDYEEALRLDDQQVEVYLQLERNVVQTAKTLFIHRSSLLKRLDKIQRLLNQDLSDPDTRLYFRICLALLRESRPPAGTAS